MVHKSFFYSFVSNKDHRFSGTQKHLEYVPVGFGELQNTERHLQTHIKMLGCFCYLNLFQVKFSPQKRCQRVLWGQGSAGSPTEAVVWVPVALSLFSEIWIQKKANTKPEATEKLPVMYLCWETAAVTRQQPFYLWASQLMLSHFYSRCLREGLNLEHSFKSMRRKAWCN